MKYMFPTAPLANTPLFLSNWIVWRFVGAFTKYAIYSFEANENRYSEQEKCFIRTLFFLYIIRGKKKNLTKQLSPWKRWANWKFAIENTTLVYPPSAMRINQQIFIIHVVVRGIFRDVRAILVDLCHDE